jgi:5'-3' exonuclease
MNKLIIDANNISNIAYHRVKSILSKEAKERIKRGEEAIVVNEYIDRIFTSFAVKIFFNIFHKYLKENKGYQIYIVWDGRYGSMWRKEHNEDYKSNRDHSRDTSYEHFIASSNAEQEILENYPVFQLKFKEVEADDIIFNLCKLFRDDHIKIITSDGDLLQLAQKFNNVEVWHPKKKKIEAVPDYDIVLFKAIAGDSSDNIFGLHKFGDKRALKAIQSGLQGLTEDQLRQIEHNKILIDLSLNPHCEKNSKMVIDKLESSKISLDPNKVKKMFFDYKLVEFLKKWDSVSQLLRQLEKESQNGGEKKES